jgi:S1-C subfamily serine protease
VASYFKLSWIVLIFIGLPAQSFALAAQGSLHKVRSNSVSPSIPQLARSLEPSEMSEMSERQLYELARSITVKVVCGKQWGSGILISKKGTTYQVLTNAHVLERSCGTRISIQTSDNKVYSVSSTNRSSYSKHDLDVVSFNAKQSYPTSSFGTTNSYTIGSEVFAAGFPSDTDNPEFSSFVLKSGQIKKISKKSFEDGYQIGYTSQVEKGMSGGPLLNRWGQVVGINGIQSYPPWASPYAFDDGSIPTKAVWEQMQQLSWAIPIRAFVNSGFSPLMGLNVVPIMSPHATGLDAPVSPSTLLGGQTEDVDYSTMESDAPISPATLKENQTKVFNSVSSPSPIEDQTEGIDYSAREVESFISPPNLKGKQTEDAGYSTSDANQPIW